jgi:hypothetical protein
MAGGGARSYGTGLPAMAGHGMKDLVREYDGELGR